LSNRGYSFEFIIKTVLCCLVLLFLTLIALLAHEWGWSLLAICTLLFVVSYPLCWLAWRGWQFWSSSIMRLTVYAQSLHMGESGVGLAHQGKSELLDDLSREIERLGRSREGNVNSEQLLSVLLGQLFENLPVAIIAFDDQLILTYANRAAYDIADVSLLQGVSATDLGFLVKGNQIQHPALVSNWRCQSSSLNYQHQSAYLFTAIDISNELKQSEQAVQKNLVRVLSHELRNTLTPMSSMTETLLGMEHWNDDQLRTVLSRIKTRSDGLLSFVERFSQVAKVPEPRKVRFDLNDVIEQTRTLLTDRDALSFAGHNYCYGDPELLAQVLINLVKNAVESVEGRGVSIAINYYQSDTHQYLTVADNGTGFSNIENAITPLFTTKAQGAGIGLAFVETVMNKHGGKVKLSNQTGLGAKVELSWPL